MLDLSVIILTYNEEKHIKRCIANVRNIAKEIFIVDSYSSDKTLIYAEKYGAIIRQNKWENNHAKQFNWALENLPISTKWILRLDADEYLTDELIEELKQKLYSLPNEITGITIKRRHIFMDKWIKKGVYPVKLLRIFEYKKAICEQRLMDEHIQLLEGESIEFDNDFIDHNLNNISWWSSKHIGYSIREAIDLLNIQYDLTESNNNQIHIGEQAEKKRKLKKAYAVKPLFIRSFIYYIYRYVFKLGFLEGKEGFLWHFLQGWWYRTLVDFKIYEIKKACGSDKEKIRKYIQKHYNINI